MLNAINKIVEEFLKQTETKPIRIISHHDTDGITSAAILIKTFQRLDKKFSVKIVKNLEQEILEKELQRNKHEVLIFTDLASNSLDYFKKLENPIFILDHHEINKEKLNNNIKIINPHLFEEKQEICGAGLSYLFSKEISKQNTDLAKLALIGTVGDRLDTNLSKISQQIINDVEELEIKKGLMIYPATRPLKRALEYSTSPYIPGVTGSSQGVTELLRETSISYDKSLIELSEDEMSKLITSIMVRRAKSEQEDIIGKLYLLKFFNTKEDVREISVLINACSRLGHSDIAIAYCLENEKAKTQALDIYTKYKQQLVSALKHIEDTEKIKGQGFVIMNAKDQIKDTIIGTVTSILSSNIDYKEGTILIGMAYNQDKIKVSARIVGKGRNLKEVLEKSVSNFKAEVGGHQKAAGCLINKQDESKFIETLKKNLEIEIMKV